MCTLNTNIGLNIGVWQHHPVARSSSSLPPPPSAIGDFPSKMCFPFSHGTTINAIRIICSTALLLIDLDHYLDIYCKLLIEFYLFAVVYVGRAAVPACPSFSSTSKHIFWVYQYQYLHLSVLRIRNTFIWKWTFTSKLTFRFYHDNFSSVSPGIFSVILVHQYLVYTIFFQFSRE